MKPDRPKFRVLTIAIAAIAAVVCATGGGPARASGGGGHGAAPAKAAPDEVSAVSADGTRAVKLGEFKIRVYHTVSSRKDTVAYVLHAVVGKKEFETFHRLYPHRKHKVRDQVVVATRLVPIDDYDDPKLEKFRRRVLLRLRRTLPELPIEDVYLSDFSLMSEAT